MNDRAGLADRFWSRVERSDGCWNWQGTITVYGYGAYQPAKGVSYRAHRLAWELTRGDIPRDKVLDHLCRNRACVNPDHLEVVTSRQNVLRGIGPSAINAAKTHCSSGHEFDTTGSKGERRCTRCDNARTGRWSRAQRNAIMCGAGTKNGGSCKMMISAGKTCRNHPTTNPLPATVLYTPEES